MKAREYPNMTNHKSQTANQKSQTANQKSQIENQKSQILVVDDNLQNVELMEAYLAATGLYAITTAFDGEEALQKVAAAAPDIILLDVMMPRLGGFEVCQRLKENDDTRLIPIIITTALGDLGDRIQGIEVGADDFLTKPVNKLELLTRVKALVRVKHLNDQLENIEQVLFTMAAIVEAKDPYTEGHMQRLSDYAVRLGRQLGVSPAYELALRHAGVLHDIGKIGIPDSILNKPAALTEAEWAVMREHPLIGDRICQSMRNAALLAPIVRGHHERWDGTGYPDGLAGEDISLGARIISVVDAYDAMTTDRPYRQALSDEKVSSEIRNGAGVQFDPAVVSAVEEKFRITAFSSEKSRK